jgi:hypothetical protein
MSLISQIEFLLIILFYIFYLCFKLFCCMHVIHIVIWKERVGNLRLKKCPDHFQLWLFRDFEPFHCSDTEYKLWNKILKVENGKLFSDLVDFNTTDFFSTEKVTWKDKKITFKPIDWWSNNHIYRIPTFICLFPFVLSLNISSNQYFKT